MSRIRQCYQHNSDCDEGKYRKETLQFSPMLFNSCSRRHPEIFTTPVSKSSPCLDF